MGIIRKRNASYKSYLPKNLRDNQYLIAEFIISDPLIEKFNLNSENKSQQPYYDVYQGLSTLFFKAADKYEIENCQFIANDKLARVRFSHEMHQWQTNQQILFYYNPALHRLQKSFFDANKRAKKVTLLFLASGEDIRINAASFHAKVIQLLGKFSQDIGIEKSQVRLRDHQHLTYDLYARSKGCGDTVAHKLRTIPKRYASQHVNLPGEYSAITYAVINLPISNSLLNLVDIDAHAQDPYNPLYTLITDTFTNAAKRYNLNNGAIIANGLIPIVRHNVHDTVSSVGELQILGYNPEQLSCGLISKWDASKLVDNIQLVFVAAKEHQGENGYSQFLNKIEHAIQLVGEVLNLDETREEVIVRFHQHLAYNL